jgi:hypothetical protein
MLAGALTSGQKTVFDNFQIVDWYIGKIICSPNTDERYDVQIYDVNSVTAEDGQITVGATPAQGSQAADVTASHMEEVFAGTHNNTVADDTPVIVYRLADRQNPPVYHWVFQRWAGGSGCYCTFTNNTYNTTSCSCNYPDSDKTALVNALGTQRKYEMIEVYDAEANPWTGWHSPSSNWPRYAQVQPLTPAGNCDGDPIYITFHTSDTTWDDKADGPTPATGPSLEVVNPTPGEGESKYAGGVGYYVDLPGHDYTVPDTDTDVVGVDLSDQRYLPWALKRGNGANWSDTCNCYETDQVVQNVVTGVFIDVDHSNIIVDWRREVFDVYGRLILRSEVKVGHITASYCCDDDSILFDMTGDIPDANV